MTTSPHVHHLEQANSKLHELRAQRNSFKKLKEERALTEDEKSRMMSNKSDIKEAHERVQNLESIIAADTDATEARRRFPANFEDRQADTRNEGLVALFEGRAATAVVEKRDFLLSGATTGGPTGATKVESRFYEVLDQGSGIWAAAGKHPTAQDESPIQLPVLVTHGDGDQELPEGDTISIDDGSTTQVTFDAYRYTCIQQVSNTLLASSAVNIQLMVTRMLAQRMSAATEPGSPSEPVSVSRKDLSLGPVPGLPPSAPM